MLTNASNGYTVTVHDNVAGLRAGAHNDTIARVTNGQANAIDTSAWPVNTFGYTEVLAGGNPTMPVAVPDPSKCAGFLSTPETIFSNTGPTGNTPDSITLMVAAKIDFAQAAGTYGDTLTYTATPSY